MFEHFSFYDLIFYSKLIASHFGMVILILREEKSLFKEKIVSYKRAPKITKINGKMKCISHNQKSFKIPSIF